MAGSSAFADPASQPRSVRGSAASRPRLQLLRRVTEGHSQEGNLGSLLLARRLGFPQPHFVQILSALIIIGESLVHTPPLLLRKILPKVTPGPQQLNSEPLQTRISRIYTNVRTVDSGLMNVRDNLCNWCPLYAFVSIK